MKRFICSIIFFNSSYVAFCQVDKNVGRYFQFNENVNLSKCDGTGNVTSGTEIINADVQFKIDGSGIMPLKNLRAQHMNVDKTPAATPVFAFLKKNATNLNSSTCW